jgi:hypothetical protein
MLAKDCIPRLIVSASLEYLRSRSQGVANRAEREGRDTSWKKIISAAGSRPWIYETIADIRAPGIGEVASTFHVTRTSLESRVSWNIFAGQWLRAGAGAGADERRIKRCPSVGGLVESMPWLEDWRHVSFEGRQGNVVPPSEDLGSGSEKGGS